MRQPDYAHGFNGEDEDIALAEIEAANPFWAR
jgi:hypothetical protein